MNELAIAADGHILRVPVSTEAVASDFAEMVCMWPDHVVRIAVDDQGYEPHELPANAVHFAMLWRFFGEYQNGGHAGYWGNTSGNTEMVRMGAELLGVMKQPAHRALLDKFGRFMADERDHLLGLYAQRRNAEADAMFRPFDDGLRDLEGRGPGLTRLLRDWLLDQPWVMLDSALDYPLYAKLRSSIPPHPAKQKREAARLRRAHAENYGATAAFLAQLREMLSGS